MEVCRAYRTSSSDAIFTTYAQLAWRVSRCYENQPEVLRALLSEPLWGAMPLTPSDVSAQERAYHRREREGLPHELALFYAFYDALGEDGDLYSSLFGGRSEPIQSQIDECGTYPS